MATVEFDPELLQRLLLPGRGAQIVSGKWLSDQFRDVLALEIHGSEVPACKTARIVFTQTRDETRPRVVTYATLHAIEECD